MTTVIVPGSMLLYSVAIPTMEAIVQLYFYLATLCSMQDLSSQTGDGTHAPCTGSPVLTTGQPGKSLLQLFLREVYINCLLTADILPEFHFLVCAGYIQGILHKTHKHEIRVFGHCWHYHINTSIFTIFH